MDALAIALISTGVWVTYCGAYGVPPIDTLVAVVQNPANARQIIEDAKAATAARLQELGVSLSSTVGAVGNISTSGNPFAGYKVNRDFADHIAKGSNGIDYGMPVGTALPSAISGTVTVSPNAGNYGHKVTVKGNGIVSTYAHLSQFNVQSGQTVKVGDVLGLSGGAKGAAGAGNSTGPHLHWEMLVNGLPADPSKYFAAKPNKDKTQVA